MIYLFMMDNHSVTKVCIEEILILLRYSYYTFISKQKSLSFMICVLQDHQIEMHALLVITSSSPGND